MVTRLARWLKTYKPAASRRSQLLCAALMWGIVGVALSTCGVWWSIQTEGLYAPLILTGALVAGLFKSIVVLKPSADRIGKRIMERGDGACLGGFLSWRLWVLVVLMSSTGSWLRSTGVPRSVLGFVYTAVGVALLTASWNLWRIRASLDA